MNPLVIPTSHTAPEFGKVTLWPSQNGMEVELTILSTPQGREAEGWHCYCAGLTGCPAFELEVLGRRIWQSLSLHS